MNEIFQPNEQLTPEVARGLLDNTIPAGSDAVAVWSAILGTRFGVEIGSVSIELGADQKLFLVVSDDDREVDPSAIAEFCCASCESLDEVYIVLETTTLWLRNDSVGEVS